MAIRMTDKHQRTVRTHVRRVPHRHPRARWRATCTFFELFPEFAPPDQRPTPPRRIYRTAVIGGSETLNPRPQFEIHGDDFHRAVITGPEEYMARRGRRFVARAQEGRAIWVRKHLRADVTPPLSYLHLELEHDYFRWLFNERLRSEETLGEPEYTDADFSPAIGAGGYSG